MRTAQVEEAVLDSAPAYAGEVTARRETALAFRVGGLLEARLVDVGDRVRRGQVLARLDRADFRLAAANVRAQLTAAQAERAFSTADLARFRALLEQNVITPPEYERRRTADTAAQERVMALDSQLRQAVNQVRYAELIAERDGVIVGFDAEIGAVVAAGQPLARLAQLDEREVTLHIPEQRIAELRPGLPADVSLWSQGGRRWPGVIREIAAAADSATRTYRVKVSLLDGQEQALLGMTATVRIPAHERIATVVPRAAVFTSHDAPDTPKVWVVNANHVHAVSVGLGPSLGGERVAVTGLQSGQTVVSAGAQRLTEGQAVAVLGQAGTQR